MFHKVFGTAKLATGIDLRHRPVNSEMHVWISDVVECGRLKTYLQKSPRASTFATGP